jgi:hypothetical protein
MTNDFWPEDWSLRDKMGARLRLYQVKGRRFVEDHWLFAVVVLIVMFFLPEIVRWFGS